MKKLIFALIVLSGQQVYASSQAVPTQYLADQQVASQMNVKATDAEFSEHVDHLMDVQQQSLEKIEGKNKKINLTQLLTSFSVSKSGIFGLSSLSTSSNTTLFWNKKKTVNKSEEEAKTFAMDSEDELALQMKIDDVTEYLVRNNKVNDSSKLRDNLEKTIRQANDLFNEVNGLETPNWRVGGYRLDLSITASGVVAPFTKVGENVRLWLEWTKNPKQSTVVKKTNVTKFVSKVLEDTEIATAKVNLPNFDLTSLYVGLGQDLKAGLFGFGSSQFGFVGYVRFAHKPRPSKATLELTGTEEAYPVIQDQTNTKSFFRRVTIPNKKIQKGIESSLKFAQFFAEKADRHQSTHWELAQIREIATITQSGLFGLSTLSTKGVFTFIFNRKAPQGAAAAPAPVTDGATHLTLIRLSFITMLGYSIPEIANFELRPNIEFFWK